MNYSFLYNTFIFDKLFLKLYIKIIKLIFKIKFILIYGGSHGFSIQMYKYIQFNVIGKLKVKFSINFINKISFFRKIIN